MVGLIHKYSLLLRILLQIIPFFFSDDIRKQAWPLLLELRPEDVDVSADSTDFKSHVEYSQVVLDVNRAIRRFPPGIPYAQRVAMQDQLIRLILRVITKYPQLKYYQVKFWQVRFFSPLLDFKLIPLNLFVGLSRRCHYIPPCSRGKHFIPYA